MQLGTALRAIRLVKQISHKRLCKTLLVKASWYSQIENNHRIPTWESLHRICTVLQEPVWKVLLLTTVDKVFVSEEFRKAAEVFPELNVYLENSTPLVDRLPVIAYEQLKLEEVNG